jgi:uncharacterized membrane protein YbaN (DUF454 family)
MGALAEVKREWSLFRHDPPGQRFSNHRIRMRLRPRSHSVVAMVIGFVFMAAGVVMLFIPGPGTLFILFGFALVASHSKRLAALFDRTEPKLRRLGHRIAHRWKGLPGRARAGLLTLIGTVAAIGMLATWKLVVSGYLHG